LVPLRVKRGAEPSNEKALLFRQLVSLDPGAKVSLAGGLVGLELEGLSLEISRRALLHIIDRVQVQARQLLLGA